MDRSEAHVIPAQPKLDVLFIIDNSASMVPFQAQVMNSLNEFIGSFHQKELDFHLGAATTMTYKAARSPSKFSPLNTLSPFLSYMSNEPARGKLLSRFMGELWLHRDSENLVSKFSQNVNFGGWSAQAGAGQERLDDSLLSVLEEDHIREGGINHGFLRPDASLAAILISDEDRSCGSRDTYCTDPEIEIA